MYDLKGRLVELYDDLNFQNDPIQFQLPDCPSGIYFLQVESGLKKEIRRITILK
ncbi:MAG: T9SS type A sorting domain-containing protein [Candidatus Cloacimonetes bacterium]|nr:T9SS type A sorting domain-containing protein [Candidatus Cloacimonadota bacterium]